jgi:hypothetical protein
MASVKRADDGNKPKKSSVRLNNKNTERYDDKYKHKAVFKSNSKR